MQKKGKRFLPKYHHTHLYSAALSPKGSSRGPTVGTFFLIDGRVVRGKGAEKDPMSFEVPHVDTDLLF